MNHLSLNRLHLNGQKLTGLALIEFCRSSDREDLNLLGVFLEQWLDDSPTLQLQTSGSTGTPAIIEVNKSQMIQSAAMTAEYFSFQAGDVALLCLPVSYVAGKMMVVRAMYSGLHLICIPPSANPLDDLPENIHIDFAPLIPLQLENVNDPSRIRNILLGGSPVPPQSEKRIQHFTSSVYHGYGMTETLSHVAIRRVNGEGASDEYHALKGNWFETDERNCLVVHASFLNQPVVTNDVAELISPTRFRWLGRFDHVINSGGIKIFPEIIESKISGLIQTSYFIAGVPDERFGEKVFLFIESDQVSPESLEIMHGQLVQCLDKYETPKQIIHLPYFERTTSGKIRRAETVTKYLDEL